jgi:hypothetical protein
MRLDTLSRTAGLALLLGGLACAGNKANDDVGAATDSTASARADTAMDQTQSGVTDSSGQSTLGKEVEKTRPDQGQPVTSKGDTINQGVDGASARQGADTSGMRQTSTDTSGLRSSMDTSRMRSGMDSSTMQSGTDTSSIRQPTDTSGMTGMDSSSTQQPTDSSSTQR